jgi:hypothetical protein
LHIVTHTSSFRNLFLLLQLASRSSRGALDCHTFVVAIVIIALNVHGVAGCKRHIRCIIFQFCCEFGESCQLGTLLGGGTDDIFSRLLDRVYSIIVLFHTAGRRRTELTCLVIYLIAVIKTFVRHTLGSPFYGAL